MKYLIVECQGLPFAVLFSALGPSHADVKRALSSLPGMDVKNAVGGTTYFNDLEYDATDGSLVTEITLGSVARGSVSLNQAHSRAESAKDRKIIKNSLKFRV